MELIKYRDAQMPNYTWFWIGDMKQVLSPYFDSEADAKRWIEVFDDSEIDIERSFE